MSADNQEPPVTSWDVEIYVDTGAVGAANAVSISGESINGSLAFELDGTEWIYDEEFQTEGAMDAKFPNNTSYTINLSGGTLGTLTQTVNVGVKAFPDVPYFTGSVYSDLQDFDPTVGFDFVFATPSGNADLTIIEIEVNDDSPFEADVAASQTTISMPANALAEGQLYVGYADHVNVVPVSGAGGFGVDGNVGHTVYSRFDVDTTSSGSIIGAWTFGDTTTEGSGVVVLMKDGTFYLAEDGEEGSDPDGFERGTYTWNAETGAFVASVGADSNGDAGLSHPVGSVTVMVSGNTLTYADSEGSTPLTRVFDPDDSLVGAWQYGEGRPDFSSVYVFLANGVYFHAVDTTTFVSGSDGMEKGSYIWNQSTGDISATVSVDTNGEEGLSDPESVFSLSVIADELAIRDGNEETLLYLVLPNTPGQAVPQVTHWSVLKGRDHFQAANNKAPPVSNWSVCVVVGTKLNLDASAMEIRGGGINGSYPLVQIDRGWTFEKDYLSEAAMNAEFPAGEEITIELSGGHLETKTQTFSLMADQYPSTPYLTGSKFTGAQSFDSFNNFQLTWNSPGSLTAASGQTILEVFQLYDDEIVFRESVTGAPTQGTVPAGTVWPGHTFYGYLEYTHARSLDGTGGFEVAGTESRNAAVDFTLGTQNSPLAGAWSFGDASGDGSGVLVFLNNGTYFHIEDVLAGSSDPDGFERGEYVWDRDTGAFDFEVLVDTNGTVGLSDSGTTQTIVVSGNSLTFTDDRVAEVLPKVTSANDQLIGGWQSGDGWEEWGHIYVFLDNGYYFGLVYNDYWGLSLDAGIERGSYTFGEVDLIPVLEATAILDTNGERGLSHVDGEWTPHLFDDRFAFNDNRGGESFADAEKGDVLNRASIFDANLENALRMAAGKTNGALLRIDMQRILKMDASGLGIVEVGGIEDAYNMRNLDLSNNQLVDVWQIDNLQELRILDLSNNEITSLSGLSLLTKLVSLDVSGNDLSDTGSSAIASDLILPSSVRLPSASTGVLAPLDGIDTLDTLRFANNNIIDLSVLISLPALKEVDLSGNDVTDLTPLSQLPQLERIVVYDNPVDLSEGSAQFDLLNTIVENTGASVSLEAPDPSGTNLTWAWDEATQRYRLVWTQFGVLQSSSNLENWTDQDSAQSPYPVDASGENPLFWRLEL